MNNIYFFITFKQSFALRITTIIIIIIIIIIKIIKIIIIITNKAVSGKENQNAERQ